MAALEEMYQCQTVNCGKIYDPDKGDRKGKIPPGTAFEDLPDNWRCPICGGTKKCFRPLTGPGSTRDANCELPTRSDAGTVPNPTTTHDPKEIPVKNYICEVCGYVYDPEQGDPDSDIAAGTSFKDLPEDWTCPICGAPKTSFRPED